MSCGHCVSNITQAIRATDKDAKLTIDLAQHLVMVEPTEADAQELKDAITEAGYTPVPVQAATVAAQPVKTGGCCGCRG
jgi:copper chaperone